MTTRDFTALARMLTSPDALVTDLTEYEDYTHDATGDRGMPDALVFASDVDDVQAVIRYCRDVGLPVVPRGAGTGLSGGCVPVAGGVVLSTERMQQLRIRPDRKVAIAGPGVLTRDLIDTAATFGLFYPPDPASYEESTLGGNVAENAGGLRCKRYGVTRDYVIGIEAVLADGGLMSTGYFNPDCALPLHELLTGSEGTLAVITSLAFRLSDRIPRVSSTLLIGFDRAEAAARTVSAVTGSGIIPLVMEYLDGDAAACANEYQGNRTIEPVAALLLIEMADTDGPQAVEQIVTLARRNGAVRLEIEQDRAKADRLWAVRRDLSKATKAIAAVRVSEDVAVPNSRFPELVAFVDRQNAESILRINSFGHAGDGNLHVNFLAMTDTPELRHEMEQRIDRLMAKTIELGGTLSGEHGIGLAKRKYLSLEYSPATLGAMSRFKTVFDPTGLLNPGKIFPA